MRRGWLLTLSLLGALSSGCGVHPPPSTPVPEGMVAMQSAESGATVILAGALSRESFSLKSVRVVGSRLAGRSSDPDQFRARLLDALGREIATVRMWSPLLKFQWDQEGSRESAQNLPARAVEIPIPASIRLETVVLSWPNKQLARVRVGPQVRRFCVQSPRNPACAIANR